MSLLKRWFSRQQKQINLINQSDVKALMQGDLVRAGIEAKPYLEESLLPMPPLGNQFRQNVPSGISWTRLHSYRALHEGQWKVQTQIYWKAGEPPLPRGCMFALLDVNLVSFHQCEIKEGMTESYSEILNLTKAAVFSLYVVHSLPYSVEVKYSISFTRVD